jgi:hypothetical protein
MKLDKRFIAIGSFFYVETVLLFFHYKPGMGDVNLIVEGGKHILADINPYENFDFANSPISGIIFYFLSLTIPKYLFSMIIPLLNATGYLLFTRMICREIQIRIPAAIIFLPLLIPYRSLVSASQITGIVLLLILPWVSNVNKNLTLIASQIICASIALELKPQLVIPFLAFSFLKDIWDRRIWILTGILIAAHTIVFLRFEMKLDSKWVTSLLIRSENSLQNSLQVSGWKLLSYVYSNLAFWRTFSAILFLAFISRFHKFDSKVSQLLLSSIAPLMLTYQHLYDLIPLVIILLIAFEENKFGVFPIVYLALFLSLPVTRSQTILILTSVVLISAYLNSIKQIPKSIALVTVIMTPLWFLRNEPIEIQYSLLSFVMETLGFWVAFRFISVMSNSRSLIKKY